MTTRIDWPAYLRTITDGATGAKIAQRTGITASTISRWLTGEVEPRPRQVVEVARAYGVHPIPALIAANYLSEEDVDLSEVTPRLLQLRDFTDLEIAQEMVRRVAEGPSAILEAPLDENHPAMQQLSDDDQ